MDIHQEPIARRIDWLFGLAEQHGADFRSPQASVARERYLAEHPTAIVALKCMDGRVNIPVATNTPAGVLQPFRNLGGVFDLGWPHLGEVLAHHVQRMTAAGRGVLVLVTYHFSRGDTARGCAGFGCDTAAAIAHVQGLRGQVEQVFGGGAVHSLVCGFETDEDALVLHGAGDLDLAQMEPGDRAGLERRLEQVLPDMPARMRADLMPLLLGNLDRIQATREQARLQQRLLDIEHREWAICLGRGFDFLHTPNAALIIGPYSPDLAKPVRSAAQIIRANMRAGRIPDDGFLLLTAAPYEEPGADQARAQLKSRFLSAFAAQVIRADVPDLADRMTVRAAVLDSRSQDLRLLETAA
jgi:hypothetical protein